MLDGDRICGSRVLDLFSGTGNLGIEALSRGARHCVFGGQLQGKPKTDKGKHRSLQGGGRSTRGGGRLPQDSGKIWRPFDIILLDPPYDKGLLNECFRADTGTRTADRGRM